MKQKHGDNSSPKIGSPETHGDGVLKDLAAKAAALAPALSTEPTGDSRRRGEIKVEGSRLRYFLKIDGVIWAEIDWSPSRNMWCVQDCCGYCLAHVEHIQTEMGNGEGGPRSPYRMEDFKPQEAIEKAKQMIRDGSMPSPEDAKARFKKNHGEDFPHW